MRKIKVFPLDGIAPNIERQVNEFLDELSKTKSTYELMTSAEKLLVFYSTPKPPEKKALLSDSLKADPNPSPFKFIRPEEILLRDKMKVKVVSWPYQEKDSTEWIVACNTDYTGSNFYTTFPCRLLKPLEDK
jgi:hypothetical protein